MEENKRNLSKGITLISLIVTIIILLILAGVVLNLALGENGIFKLATEAAKNYSNEQEKEQYEIAKLNNTIGQYVDGTRDIPNYEIYNLEDLNTTYNPYGLPGFIIYDKVNRILEINLQYKDSINMANTSKILDLGFINGIDTTNIQGQKLSGTGMAWYSNSWGVFYLQIDNNNGIALYNTNGFGMTIIGTFSGKIRIK